MDTIEVLYYAVGDNFIRCSGCDNTYDLVDLSINPNTLREHAKSHGARTMILTKIIHITEVDNGG